MLYSCVCVCVLPVYARAGNAQCDAQINRGPVGSRLPTVTALSVPWDSLHLLQGLPTRRFLIPWTQTHTSRRHWATAISLLNAHIRTCPLITHLRPSLKYSILANSARFSTPILMIICVEMHYKCAIFKNKAVSFGNILFGNRWKKKKEVIFFCSKKCPLK